VEDRIELFHEVFSHINTEEVVALTRKLISIPSYAPDGEKEAAEELVRFMMQYGIPTSLQKVSGDTVNLIACLPSESDEVGLLLNGHLDTVPPSSAMRFPPFDGRIEGGLMWGRGAADMKGGLAAMACALVALKNSAIPLKRSLILSAVSAEERGNLGTATLLRQVPRAQWAIVGEPTSLDLVIAHKGVDRFQIVVEGKAAHESMPHLGVNAILYAARLIVALENKLFRKANQRHHPLLGRPTYNIGTIQGGISRNTVPDRCIFQISKRWLPGDSPEAIRNEIEEVVRSVQAVDPSAHVSVEREKELEEIPHPPFEISSDHPLVQTLASIVLTVTGRAPTFRGLPVFTDAALLQAAGIPAVLCGPGDIALAHSDDESVPLSDLELAAKIYAGAAIIACNIG
jgi:acetylornithine deacetylase/succinyl-diaminopimelate desuccinylase family protein